MVADEKIDAHHEEGSSQDESMESARNFQSNRKAQRRRTDSEESDWLTQHTIVSQKKYNFMA